MFFPSHGENHTKSCLAYKMTPFGKLGYQNMLELCACPMWCMDSKRSVGCDLSEEEPLDDVTSGSKHSTVSSIVVAHTFHSSSLPAL